MAILTDEQLRKTLLTKIPERAPHLMSKDLRMLNIKSFNEIDRANLAFRQKEKRILLYNTKAGEKIYIQLPGKESVRDNRRYELDFRPVLQKSNGEFIEDMNFQAIWDIVDEVGTNHKKDLDLLAILFLRMAYMVDYEYCKNDYPCELIDSNGVSLTKTTVKISWYRLVLDDDVIETLNDRFSDLKDISLEGFLYYNDLLAQNEDCKYSFFQGDSWDQKAGRINNCLSHLSVISHLQRKLSLSELINRFQRSRGVAPIPQKDFVDACGNLVERY